MNKRWFVFLVTSVLLASTQYHMILEAFGDAFGRQIIATEGIIDGVPQWGKYMMRLLGPYMIEGMHRLTGWDFETSYHVVTFLLLTSFFISILNVAYSIFRSAMTALAIAIAAGFVNGFVMQGTWLYTWDLIHLTLFTVLIWAIMKKKPLWFICLLVVIEIFNHPLFLIIAAWLVFDAVIEIRRKNKLIPTIILRPKLCQMLLGVSLGTGGYFLVIWISDTLLLATTMEESTLALYEEWGTEIIRIGEASSVLPLSLEVLKSTILFDSEAEIWASRFGSNHLIIFTPLIFGIPALCIMGIFSRNVEVVRICILFLLLWGAIFLTSLFYETRVWLPFTPFLVLAFPMVTRETFGKRGRPATETSIDT